MEELMPVTYRERQQGRAARGSRGVFLASLGAALAVVCMAAPAAAQGRPRPQASSFSANKTFGLGIMIGAPTAISGKYYLGADTAVDFGVGVIQGFRRDGLHLHADFLWHPATLVTAEPFVMPFYVGIGGRIADFEDDPDGDDEGDFNLGVRAPVGLMLDFNNVPLDVFFELALVIDFIGYDGVDADFNGALGVRYYFM
jgi:hypothetical protein